MKQTKVLVIGSDGQLGNEIQTLAKKEKTLDFVFTNRSALDITDVKEVAAVFTKHTFDYCINCAAYTDVEQAEKEPLLAEKINYTAVKNLAKQCAQNNVILIHISTDFVFDGKSQTPYKETAVTHPINQYGKTKLQGELAIKELATNYFIIRTSWLYGEKGNNFVKTILRLSEENDQISVVTDQIGSPTNAKDLAEFIHYLIFYKKTDFGIFHFSNKGATSRYYLAQKVIEFSNKDCELKTTTSDSFLSKVKRPKYSVLDTSKIQTKFEYHIRNWEEALQDFFSKKTGAI